jgi:tetratricopeptide (TPR) repeat protein
MTAEENMSLAGKILQGIAVRSDEAESAWKVSPTRKPRVVSTAGALVLILALAIPWHAAALTPEALKLFRQGYAAGMARQWEDAIRLYSESLKLDPGDVNTRFQRAIVFEVAGRPDDAIRDYERVLKQRPDYYQALEYLAKLYEEEGRYSAALALYKRALPMVRDPKWRSIVRWWIACAKKKLKAAHNSDAKTARRRHRSKRPLF